MKKKQLTIKFRVANVDAAGILRGPVSAVSFCCALTCPCDSVNSARFTVLISRLKSTFRRFAADTVCESEVHMVCL